MNRSDVAGLAGWTPIRLLRREGGVGVDWCRLPEEPFTDAFFEQTISRALSHPARLLFRRTTPLEVLADFDRERPGLAPAGFIFHMSRCGSTLLAQMLAALAGSIVVAEAPPIDQVLRLREHLPAVRHEDRLHWFRGMINALGQRRGAGETRYFVKMDCWHTLELPFVLEAFPDVPWVFLYRDPVEVLVSHQRRCGSQMVPGVLDPRAFAIEPAALATMPFHEYGARVLARVCRAAAVAQASLGNGRLVNFAELPAAGWEWLAGFFGQELGDGDRERMRAVSRRNAKNPAEPHVDDRAAKQAEADEETRRLAREWLGDVYAELETARATSGGRPPTPALIS